MSEINHYIYIYYVESSCGPLPYIANAVISDAVDYNTTDTILVHVICTTGHRFHDGTIHLTLTCSGASGHEWTPNDIAACERKIKPYNSDLLKVTFYVGNFVESTTPCHSYLVIFIYLKTYQ